MAKQTLEQLTGSPVRQSIITRPVREIGARDTHAVCAACAGRSVTVPWDDALDIRANHAAAALQLMAVLGWGERNHLVMGSTPDEFGYVFVQVEPRVTADIADGGRPGHPTTIPVAESIAVLRKALHRDYGSDYAFTVMCRGYVVAASNVHHGTVVAVGTPDADSSTEDDEEG